MQNESRKVLVTGGAGFIGSHVAEAYLSRGDRVWIVDDLSSGHMENVPAGATFVRLDVAEPEVKELICEEGFDLINHHAAQIDVRVSVTAPLRDAGQCPGDPQRDGRRVPSRNETGCFCV